ncbi:hypothetical protein BpHYR1_048856 [Brachionus plicatilis]|uniref:Uncharacterized protein n=1 Tax=Brachionus plicatilis TaxID=10195 RepID=A0A3M7SLS7_BRAPC|nr:hypothetical protein BpHYR1_048856 [Brachionus plicatilis]
MIQLKISDTGLENLIFLKLYDLIRSVLLIEHPHYLINIYFRLIDDLLYLLYSLKIAPQKKFHGLLCFNI